MDMRRLDILPVDHRHRARVVNRVGTLGLAVLLLGAAAVAEASGGLFVFKAAADSVGALRATDLVGSGQRALVWESGVVTMPDSLACEPYGADDLAVATLPGLSGITARGRFDLAPGRYDLDEPLLLTDGRMAAYLTSGTLDVETGLVVYARPSHPKNTHASYLLLAGIVLGTWVLLLNLRRRTRSR